MIRWMESLPRLCFLPVSCFADFLVSWIWLFETFCSWFVGFTLAVANAVPIFTCNAYAFVYSMGSCAVIVF